MASYSAFEVEGLTKIRGDLIAREQLMSAHFNKLMTSSSRNTRKFEEDVENLRLYQEYLEPKLRIFETLAKSRAQSFAVFPSVHRSIKVDVSEDLRIQHEVVQHEVVQHEVVQHEVVQHEVDQQEVVQHEVDQQEVVQHEVDQQEVVQHEFDQQEVVQHEVDQQEVVQHEVIKHEESLSNCLQYSSSSSTSPRQLSFIVRPSVGEQKQLVRFSTKKLVENKLPNSYTFFGMFPLELRGQILTVNLLIRKGQNEEYDLITCFPRVNQQEQPEDSPYYGFAEVIITVVDTSGLPAIAKNFIVNVGNGNGCEGEITRRDLRRCQCDTKNGTSFLVAADLALFLKCLVVKKKRPFMMLQFNAQITMRILPTSFTPFEETASVPNEVLVQREGDHLIVAEDLIISSAANDNLNEIRPVAFVPIDDFDEEIMTGLSPNTKKAYREWVCYKNLNEWRQNLRINIELLHFAQHNALMELISHIVENLSRIPHDQCSLEENLEVVTAGVMYGNASLLQRSVDHLGTRLA